MAARCSWIVLIDDDNSLISDDQWAGKVNIREGQKEIIGVFFREGHAQAYAQSIASFYPKREVHVYKQYRCYSSQPKPVEVKVWTENGELIPMES